VSGGARASASRGGPSSSPSLARIRGAAGGASRGVGGGDREAGWVSHLSALVRDAFDRGGVRYSHYPGAVGASRRAHDDGVHARIEPGAAGGTKSGRSVVGAYRGEGEPSSPTRLGRQPIR